MVLNMRLHCSKQFETEFVALKIVFGDYADVRVRACVLSMET